jgi:ligand-binding SRPBCC domain-containing protein
MPDDWDTNLFKSIICPWIVDTGDCNDGDDTIYGGTERNPAAPEICDGVDNNCNGIVDEGCSSVEKASTLAMLKTLSTSDPKSNKELQEGINWLTKSLGNLVAGGDKKIVWLDSTHLACRHGEKAFDDEKKAVEHLQKVTDYAIISQVQLAISSIVQADRLLALTAINEAPAGKDKNKAIENFNKGEAATDNKHKIQYYRKAWKYVNKDCEKKGKVSCIDEITVLSPSGDLVSAIGDDVGHPETVFTDALDNQVIIHTSCSRCLYVGQVINGWTITTLIDDGSLALKCAKK